MMRFVFATGVALAAANVPFEDFKTQHGKVYESKEEEARRQAIFEENLEIIATHNAQDLSYKLGVNEFADLTNDEFIAQYTGLDGRPNMEGSAFLGTLEEEEVGDAIDWVGKGVVNPIKNQGKCGSCWAFSAVGALESAWAISTGKLLKISEQQLVDCDKAGGNAGCNGGWPHSAYDAYYGRKHGACSEGSYKYTGKGGSCRASSCTLSIPAGTITGHKDVGKSQSGLKSALGQQPVSVAVNAGQLQLYANGVVKGNCRGSVNHAVVAVGYGTDGIDYFKIRNSWGTSWGESGYVRLAQEGGSKGTACLYSTSPVVPSLSTSVAVDEWEGSFTVAVDEWEAWKQEHGKVYNGDEEDAYRHSVFEANMARIPKLQEENPYAEFGATYLSDLTEEELPVGWIPSDVQMPEVPLGNVTVADSKDWTGTCTTPIKDQKSCGSCWAFSAVEQIESMYILKKQSTIVLAPQELVDCKADKSQRNGCGGGNPDGKGGAYDVLMKLGGICAETDYPYTAKNGRCSFKESTVKVKVLSHGSVSSESKMKGYVGSTAPLSICHQTGGWSSYKSGIMTSCGSGGGHCTQIVGYGDGNGMTYWKVRNSWGSRFGEAGHIRIQYGKGLCGIKSGMTVDVDSVGSGDGSVLV